MATCSSIASASPRSTGTPAELTAAKLTTVTMELPVPTGLTYLPYVVGSKYGIFKKYGIKLTMQVIKPPLAVTLIEDGKLDVMGATGSAESASIHGRKMPTYVAQGIRNDFCMVALKTISSLKQLKGKVIIGAAAISATNEWESAVLKANGVTPTHTVSFVTVGEAPSAREAYLKAGKGAATVLNTAQCLQLKRTGYPTVTFGNIPQTELVAGGFATLPTFADSHKRLMQDLVRATIASTDYVNTHEAQSVKVLEGKSYTFTHAMAREVYKAIKPNWVLTGKPPKSAISLQLKTLQAKYKLSSPPKASTIFTWKFIPKKSPKA